MLYDYDYSAWRPLAHMTERVVDALQGKAGGNIGPDRTGGDESHCVGHVEPGAIARADDFQFTLSDFGGLERRSAGLLTYDDDLAASDYRVGGDPHGGGGANAVEDALRDTAGHVFRIECSGRSHFASEPELFRSAIDGDHLDPGGREELNDNLSNAAGS
jgi:hypothetical protein